MYNLVALAVPAGSRSNNFVRSLKKGFPGPEGENLSSVVETRVRGKICQLVCNKDVVTKDSVESIVV